jgi:hypothetical protein
VPSFDAGEAPRRSTSSLDNVRNVCAGFVVDNSRFRSRAKARSVIWGLSTLAVCLLGLGCTSRDDLIVWRADALSPDGRWVATADTVQNGGFGSGDIFTTVHLRNTQGKPYSVDVLGIDSQGPSPRPYVLDNVANRGGSIDLTMSWTGPSRLHLGYTSKTGTVVTLQMVKYAGIDILVDPREEKANASDTRL